MGKHLCCRAAAFATAVLVLAGCQPGGFESSPASSRTQNITLPAAPTKMPRYSDALAGIYGTPARTVPADVAINYYAPGGGTGKPGRAVLTMALVPGPNYAKLRDYLAQARQDVAMSAPSTGDQAQHDLDVKPVLRRAVDIVKARYPWIEFSDDLATAQKREASLTLVLDIRGRLAPKSGDATAVQIEVIVFNDQRKPIARFVAEGKANAFGLDGYNFTPAADHALAALAQKSSAYFN